MTMRNTNLLTDPVFGVRYADDRLDDLTLPHLLAVSQKGEDIVLTGCRPHQRHAIHAFLVSLAFFVWMREQVTELPQDPDWWEEVLRRVAGGDEPWMLVRDDPSEPAFMQPPASDFDPDGWKILVTPDEADTLNSAANHSLKRRTIGHPRPEHWVYALISAQTIKNSGDCRYIGASRVPPSGRSFVGLSPGHNWGARFVRDVRVWKREWPNLVNAYGYASSPTKGYALLWLLDWNTPLRPCDLFPAYIDVCQRIRLTYNDNLKRVVAYRTPAKRRLPADTKGITGDIWMPLIDREKKDGSVTRTPLYLPPEGFTYEILHAALFGEGANLNPALKVMKEDGLAPLLIASGISRKNGKTRGFHQRILPVPPHVRAVMEQGGDDLKSTTLGQLSTKFVKAATGVKEALKEGLAQLKSVIAKDTLLQPQQELRRRIDHLFFDRLFAAVGDDAEEDAIVKQWTKELLDIAEELLLQGLLTTLPLPPHTKWSWGGKALNAFRKSKFKLSGEPWLPVTTKSPRTRRHQRSSEPSSTASCA